METRPKMSIAGLPRLTDEDFFLSRKILCEKSLRYFIQEAWATIEPETNYVFGWHIDAISDHLMAVTNGQIKRLIINIPPRHMKSLSVCVFWPCWEWIQKVGEKYIFASYAATLSYRDSVRRSRLINSPWFRSYWSQINLVKDTGEKIENERGGYMVATSVGGVATGEGGDKIIVDDPHNVRDVESEIIRLSALMWWDEVMSSRLNSIKTGVKIIIMQRSHDNDLTGHELAKEIGYEHLCLPARYEGENRCKTSLGFVDPRTETGEALYPDRFSAKDLDTLEKELGRYAAAAQLQQRPAPREGGMFNMGQFKLIRDINLSTVKAAVRYWDKAGTEGGGCYSCGVLMYRTGEGGFIVADCIYGQWSAANREREIKLADEIDNQRAKQYSFRHETWIEKEGGSGGKESAENTIRNLAGSRVYADRVTGEKSTRAEPFSIQLDIGNVSLYVGEWTDFYLRNMRDYPKTTYKDFGDATGGAFNHLMGAKKKSGVWGRRG